MFRTISILDFDGIYERQDFYRPFFYERIDLKRMESVSRFCTRTSFLSICEKLRKNPFRRMAFLGSGNYHYVTLALVSVIRTPFTLVLFDHHTDILDEPSKELISCGGWVHNALDEMPNLIKVLIIGADGNDPQKLPERFKSRVELIPNHRLREEEAMILGEIPTRDVYLSVDKDALSPMDAATDWDQGKMRLGKLLKILDMLAKSRRIVGADVCGEFPMGETLVQTTVAMEKNDAANRQILETLYHRVRQGNRHISVFLPKGTKRE